jgi:hypothetical protein
VRLLLILVGMLGCAGQAKPLAPASPTQIAALRTAVLSAQRWDQLLQGPETREAIVCAVALEIDSWYGAGDDGPWTLTAADMFMMPSKGNLNFRDELVRFGIRGCVLDVHDAAR